MFSVLLKTFYLNGNLFVSFLSPLIFPVINVTIPTYILSCSYHEDLTFYKVDHFQSSHDHHRLKQFPLCIRFSNSISIVIVTDYRYFYLISDYCQFLLHYKLRATIFLSDGWSKRCLADVYYKITVENKMMLSAYHFIFNTQRQFFLSFFSIKNI